MLSHLRITPLDGLRLRLRVDSPALRADVFALLADVFALLADVGQHLRSECGQVSSAQGQEVLGFDRMHIEHEAIVQTPSSSRYGVFFQLHLISH